MKVNLLFLLLLIPFLWGASCRKQQALFSPKMQIGANNFSCKINGKLFIPYGSIGYQPKLETFYNPSNGNFYLYVSNRDLFDKNFITSMIFRFRNKEVFYQLHKEYPLDTSCSITILTNDDFLSKEGHVVFTEFDLEQNIASGIFSFKAVDARGSCLDVTEGKFHVHFLLPESHESK